MVQLKGMISLLLASDAFAFTPSTFQSSNKFVQPSRIYSTNENDVDMNESNILGSSTPLLDRRSILLSGVVATSAISTWSSFSSSAFAEDASIGSDASKPIAVIGAGGKCGKLSCEILMKKKLYARAITRSGRSVLDTSTDYVSYAPGDVTNYESIKEAVKGCSGVIFAASASGKKKGGDPEHVDFLGLYNTAKACLECEVPKLVAISAGSVTRPDFVGFKATNFFVKYVYGDHIMDAKVAGEGAMRDLYASSPNPANCAYCVVRPGGLSDGEADGPSQVHVSQGDYYTAEISRTDVAEVSVAALLNKSTDFTTFELNKMKGLNAATDTVPKPPDALVHAGSKEYAGLFDGLVTDKVMKEKYPVYINDFRGDGLKPLSSLV